MNAYRVRRLASRVAAMVAEMNEAQRRVAVPHVVPDSYLTRPGAPPDSYAEFLARTSGPLIREPSASERSRSARLLPTSCGTRAKTSGTTSAGTRSWRCPPRGSRCRTAAATATR